MNFLLIILLTSCALKHNFAGKNFESSKSLCLDALVVNMDADACQNIVAEHDEEKKILKLYCSDDHVDGRSPWLNHIFYFASSQVENIGLPGMTMCVDPNLTMTYEPIPTQ